MSTNSYRLAPIIVTRFAIVGLTVVAAPGCGLGGAPSDESALPDLRLPDGSRPPTFEEFLGRGLVLEGGRLIVDQDILVENEAMARAYHEREMNRSARLLDAPEAPSGLGIAHLPLSVHVVDEADDVWAHPQKMGLTYCVNAASFGTNANLLIETLEQATYSWSRRTGVSFQCIDLATCDNTTIDVAFNVRQTTLPTGVNAAAFYPSWPRSSRELLLAPTAFTNTSGGRDLLGILSHELGHVLGAPHEHIWLTPSCTRELPDSVRQITEYDVNSVMHYPQCRPSGTGGYRQSELDYVGMHTIYGMAPALIMSLRM
ncbi:matrixin family metalloprotease [Sorangium sp. So ce385]|uniref:matrixin family metalloprotease n=1 Tax=Sorangium sp. So ce385 TaxID=3133308 RepID=UPI003F5C9079